MPKEYGEGQNYAFKSVCPDWREHLVDYLKAHPDAPYDMQDFVDPTTTYRDFEDDELSELFTAFALVVEAYVSDGYTDCPSCGKEGFEAGEVDYDEARSQIKARDKAIAALAAKALGV